MIVLSLKLMRAQVCFRLHLQAWQIMHQHSVKVMQLTALPCLCRDCYQGVNDFQSCGSSATTHVIICYNVIFVLLRSVELTAQSCPVLSDSIHLLHHLLQGCDSEHVLVCNHQFHGINDVT